MAITPKDTIKQIEYYAAVLTAARIRDSAAQLADRARNALRMCLIPSVCPRRR
jgi:hypothetical protein